MIEAIRAYPKFMSTACFMGLVLLAMLFVPPVSTADATTVASPVQTTGAETIRSATRGPACKGDWPYISNCISPERKIRVIKY
jgi:cytochrome c-type biogenesis protein CcmH/NrfF